jgi:hypothetical protein
MWRVAFQDLGDGGNVIMSNFIGAIMLYGLRYGYTVITVMLDDEVYEGRVRMRSDLKKLPIRKWRQGTTSGLLSRIYPVSQIMTDFDKIEKYLTKRTYTYMAHPAMKSDHLESFVDDHARFGHCVRERAMIRSNRDGYIYHGLGDEEESFATAISLGALSVHTNKVKAEPLGIDSGFDDVMNAKSAFGYTVNEDLHVGEGQRKLFAVDSPLLTGPEKYVVAIGGSPGTHFLKSKWLFKKLIIIDMVEPSKELLKNSNVKFIRHKVDKETLADLLPDDTYVVLWDIRRPRNGMNDADWEEAITADNAMMYHHYHEMMKDTNCKAISLKIRPQRGSELILLPARARILFQPYAWGGSTECRGYWFRSMGDDFDMRIMKYSKYERLVRYWNYRRIFTGGSFERDQEGALLTMRMRIGDMQDVYPVEWSQTYAIFSVSNASNYRELSRELAYRGVNVIIPRKTHLNLERYGITEHNGILTSQIKGRSFIDHTYSPSEFKYHNTMNMNDFFVYCDYNVDSYDGSRRDNYPRSGFDGRHPFMNLWFIVMPVILPYQSWQTWFNSQTHLVRILTPSLRRVFGLDKDSLHLIRRKVAKAFDYIPIKHSRVSGYKMVGDQRYYVAASGHMSNLLLVSPFTTVNWHLYIRSIWGNVQLYSRKKGMMKEYNMLIKKNMLAEANVRLGPVLWHSYDDYKLSIGVAFVTAFQLGIPIDIRAARLLLLELNDIRSKYPKFKHMGFQSREFALQTGRQTK